MGGNTLRVDADKDTHADALEKSHFFRVRSTAAAPPVMDANWGLDEGRRGARGGGEGTNQRDDEDGSGWQR